MHLATLTLLAIYAISGPTSINSSMQQQIDNYLTTDKWPALLHTVEAWSRLAKADRARLIELLAPSLTNCKRVPLYETADLIIPYRTDKGDLKFQGHGLVVRQDLFTIGGRAAWAIGKLLDVDLPELHGGLTIDEWNKRIIDIQARVKKLSQPEKIDR